MRDALPPACREGQTRGTRVRVGEQGCCAISRPIRNVQTTRHSSGERYLRQIVVLAVASLAWQIPLPVSAQNAEQTSTLRLTRKLLDQTLKDFESARFKEVYVSFDGNEVCGKVNSKNGYGAFSGWQRFHVYRNIDGPNVSESQRLEQEIAERVHGSTRPPSQIAYESGDEARTNVADGLRFVMCKTYDRWKTPPTDHSSKLR